MPSEPSSAETSGSGQLPNRSSRNLRRLRSNSSGWNQQSIACWRAHTSCQARNCLEVRIEWCHSLLPRRSLACLTLSAWVSSLLLLAPPSTWRDQIAMATGTVQLQPQLVPTQRDAVRDEKEHSSLASHMRRGGVVRIPCPDHLSEAASIRLRRAPRQSKAVHQQPTHTSTGAISGHPPMTTLCVRVVACSSALLLRPVPDASG